MEEIRLQKYFSDMGIMSRRMAEAEILLGKVKVNGEIAHVGQKISPEIDIIEYCGKVISKKDLSHEKIYIMLNKPCGYLSSVSDDRGRKCVTDLVQKLGARLYPVGRLDMNSEGLLLMTNDGELTNKLTHPRHEIPKIYHVEVSPSPDEDQLATLRSALLIDGYRIQEVDTVILEKEESSAILQMTLFEGRNRQIRKMCDIAGLRVQRLKRVAIGTLTLGSLKKGEWRHLTPTEVAYLKKSKD